jgi:carboxylate-amine ligase
VRALNGMRAHIPVLLALSANSPFTRGTDSGLASARTPVFQAFPRTGIPRAMADYADYVEAIDVLMRCGAIPEPTFIWWDVRLQPKLGTLEVRVMDAQTRIRDTAALAALVQCLVRLEALDEPDLALAPEVIDENRFLAARDGIHAQLLDPCRDRCVPAAGRLATLVDACWPHARALGCERELALLAHLAGDPGAVRQRAIASEPEGLPGLLHTLQAEFSPPRPQLAVAA